VTRFELVPTPARRTVDLFFDGKPDLGRIEAAMNEDGLQGAWVRVRWTVADEERHEVDREAIKRALAGAADVQLEGRIVPVVRSRAEGISRCASLSAKVSAWAAVAGAKAEPLLADLERLSHQAPEQIAAEVLSRGEAAGTVWTKLPPPGEEVAVPDSRPARAAAETETELF
jgi:exonuclease SbcD